MKANIFELMVVGWSDKLEWSKNELKQAVKLLLTISKANAGEIVTDEELNTEGSNDFALQQVEAALARRVITYAKMLREKFVRPRYTTTLEQQITYVIPELISSEWKDCTDINNDDADALCKLPGINPDIALQLIEYRKVNGPLSEPEQLTNIQGIGAEIVDAIKHQIFFGTSEQISPITKEISAFIYAPSFKNYVELIIETKDVLALSVSENEDPKTQILAELKKALDDVTDNKYGIAKNLHYTRASRILSESKRKEVAKKINDNGTRSVNCGALLYDNQYSQFLNKLIEQATKSIQVIMFFMKYEDGADYIVNLLVEGLLKAHKNGLEVKVILDKDAEDDKIGSRLINEPAFNLLKSNNVSVLYDRLDRMTHSKLVIVDGMHVVVGSHNWTGGSLLAYDDTSIYVESRELGQKYQVIFDAFWDEYNNPT